MPDTLRFGGNLSAVVAHVRQAAAKIEQDMRAAEGRIAMQAKALAIQGTNMGVYNTAPGRYVRQGDLLRGIDARPLASGPGQFGVEVVNTSQHATQVEFGSYAEHITEASAEIQAEALGPTRKSLYLKRSGKKWQKPNPSITRATVFAMFSLQDAFAKSLRKRL